MTTYRQCLLQKKNTQQVSFIPTKFATLGRVLKLKNEDGEFEDGWVVMSAGSETPEHLLPDSHIAVKKHRKATGDSMAKKDFAKA